MSEWEKNMLDWIEELYCWLDQNGGSISPDVVYDNYLFFKGKIEERDNDK